MSTIVTTKSTGESFFLRGVTIIISGAATIYFGITSSHFKNARDEGCDELKNSEAHSLYIFNLVFAIVFAIIFVYALFALFYDMSRNGKLTSHKKGVEVSSPLWSTQNTEVHIHDHHSYHHLENI